MAVTRKQMYLEKINNSSLSVPTPVTMEEKLIDGVSGNTLPIVDSSDVDKVLKVINGKWVADYVDRSTVLFTDGTLIINEVAKDRAANVAEHGMVVKEYPPLDATHIYRFIDGNSSSLGLTRPYWYNDRTSITSIKIGSYTKVAFSMAYWFKGCTNLVEVDFANLDTSKSKSMIGLFDGDSKLETIKNIDNFDVAKSITMASMFQGCSSLTELNLSSFNTSKINAYNNMFKNCNNLRTIYVSDKFVIQNEFGSQDMFLNCTSLVGGAGTTYDANHIDKEYARIDDPEHGKAGYFTSVEQWEAQQVQEA